MIEDEGDKGERSSEDDQEFLKKIEQTMLSQVVLQGVAGVRKVFLRDAKSTFPDPEGAGDGYLDQNEWVLDTEGTNLLEVCIPATAYWSPLQNRLGKLCRSGFMMAMIARGSTPVLSSSTPYVLELSCMCVGQIQPSILPVPELVSCREPVFSLMPCSSFFDQ